MTEPAQEANAAPAKRQSIRTRRIVWSLLIACCVFAGFAVYAYTAPTTYQTQVEVVLHAPERLEASLYPIADRRQRLVKVLAGPEATKQIAQALSVTTPDARLELARNVRWLKQILGRPTAVADPYVSPIHDPDAAPLRPR